MTQAPERPRTAVRGTLPQVRRDEGAWLPALLLAVRTTAYGLIGLEVIVLLLWTFAAHSGSSAGQTLRVGLGFWAAAHHASIRVGAASIGVVPWTLTAFPAWLLHRGTRTVLSADRRVEPVAYVPALAVCYGVLTAAAALAGRGPGLAPAPAEAFVGGAVVAVVAAGSAAFRVRGVPSWVPLEVEAAARSGGRALGALLLAGLATSVVWTLVHLGDVTRAAAALHPGGVSAVGLVLLDLLVLPTVGVYGTSVLAGPGFGFGAHTSVSLAGAHLAGVPAVPVLAALPRTGSFSWAAFLLLLVPVAVGAWAARPALAGPDRVRTLGGTAVAGGVGMAVVAWLAGGSAGPGRLAVTGPSPWQTGLAVAGELAVGGALALAAAEVRRRR